MSAENRETLSTIVLFYHWTTKGRSTWSKIDEDEWDEKVIKTVVMKERFYNKWRLSTGAGCQWGEFLKVALVKEVGAGGEKTGAGGDVASKKNISGRAKRETEKNIKHWASDTLLQMIHSFFGIKARWILTDCFRISLWKCSGTQHEVEGEQKNEHL